MRPTTYLVGFLAAATATLATPDISGLPQGIVNQPLALVEIVLITL